ncbi:MAG: DUF4157 domain-containing protein [Pseudomonadota bacterium]
MQTLGETAQRLNARPALVAQRALAAQLSAPAQRAPAPNRTGLPDGLKAGIESLSGMAMDDVRVHRNSSAPSQLQAHAYAQGTDIHLAPGQDHHLPHEAWHVVQQKQGRVKATLQMKGTAVNDDAGLEHEADVMGAKAMNAAPAQRAATLALPAAAPGNRPVQRAPVVYRNGSTLGKTARAQVIELANDLETAVKFATTFLKANPQLKGLGLSSGYLDAWVTSFDLMISTKAIPEFFYARYGYAVETIAAAHMPSSKGSLTVTTQYATGATRPDFVIWDKHNDIAWLDITSSASTGHILRKQHSGWSTRPYVAEVVYAPPKITDFKGKKLTKSQKEALTQINTAAAQTEEDYTSGLEEVSVVVEEALTNLSKKGKITKGGAKTALHQAVQSLMGEVTAAQAGEVVRCVEVIEVGGESASGHNWATWAFGGQGYKDGRALIIRYGKKLRGGIEEESEGKSEEHMSDEE